MSNSSSLSCDILSHGDVQVQFQGQSLAPQQYPNPLPLPLPIPLPLPLTQGISVPHQNEQFEANNYKPQFLTPEQPLICFQSEPQQLNQLNQLPQNLNSSQIPCINKSSDFQMELGLNNNNNIMDVNQSTGLLLPTQNPDIINFANPFPVQLPLQDVNQENFLQQNQLQQQQQQQFQLQQQQQQQLQSLEDLRESSVSLPLVLPQLAQEQNQQIQLQNQQQENEHAMQLVEEMLQELGLCGNFDTTKDVLQPNQNLQTKVDVLPNQFEEREQGQDMMLGQVSSQGQGQETLQGQVQGQEQLYPLQDTLTSQGLLNILQAGLQPPMSQLDQRFNLVQNQNVQGANFQQLPSQNNDVSLNNPVEIRPKQNQQGYVPFLNIQELQQSHQAGMISDDTFNMRIQEAMVSPALQIRQNNLNNEQKYLRHKRAEIDKIVKHPPERGLSLLNMNFEDLASYLEPTREEKLKMEHAKEIVFELLGRRFESSKCFVYGSAGNQLCIREHNDVDLCIRIQNKDESQEFQSQIVDKIAGFMDEQRMIEVRSLPHARVPICKFTVPETGTHIDISVNNLLPVFNTRLLAKYCEIDLRVRKLVYIVKFWAKRKILNDPYHNTLSSYAYVLMVIFFLQQKGILPCLQQLGTMEPRLFHGHNVYFEEEVENLVLDESQMQDMQAMRDTQMGELTMMFFDFYAWEFFEFKCRDSVICVRLGEFIKKEEKGWTCKTGYQRHLLSIEDPFETDHDLGKLVDKNTLSIIAREFQKASKVLHQDMEPQKCLFRQRRWSPDSKRRERPPRGWRPREQTNNNNNYNYNLNNQNDGNGDSEGESAFGTSPQ